MKRNPRKVKWTKAYRALHGKDMTQDITSEFERKRNRPDIQDRNVTADKLKAMKVIFKARNVRQMTHMTERFLKKKRNLREWDKKAYLASNHVHELTKPRGTKKIRIMAQPKSEENRAMEE